MAGELRWQLRERRLAFRCQPPYIFFVVVAIMSFRALVQAVKIRRASLLICISSVFRDHIVHDYRFPLEKTVVITNPVRLSRFANKPREVNSPPVVLVPIREPAMRRTVYLATNPSRPTKRAAKEVERLTVNWRPRKLSSSKNVTCAAACDAAPMPINAMATLQKLLITYFLLMVGRGWPRIGRYSRAVAAMRQGAPA